ncbi:uncharacterized protein [Dendropsophus ebraccatus]|uniref:uncharacterized protein isoform X1 n=1 Tax=Dendropsophus ebraccatus TaxID=150705 RepID=UPI003831B9B9
MRFIFLLVFLDLIHPTHCGISSWIQTILSYENTMEKPPPPPPTMFADFSSWINNIMSYDRPIDKPPPPPPPTMFEEFLDWMNKVLSVPVPPAHRRTRERCIGVSGAHTVYCNSFHFCILQNSPSKTTGPREKLSIIKKVYIWIKTIIFGEPPPPRVPPGCTVTLRHRVLSGGIFGLLILPICALVVLAAWLAHEEELLTEQAPSSDANNLQPDLESVQDPLRAADVPEPLPLAETAEDQQNAESLRALFHCTIIVCIIINAIIPLLRKT